MCPEGSGSNVPELCNFREARTQNVLKPQILSAREFTCSLSLTEGIRTLNTGHRAWASGSAKI